MNVNIYGRSVVTLAECKIWNNVNVNSNKSAVNLVIDKYASVTLIHLIDITIFQ